MSGFRLYIQYAKMNFRCIMQYKTWFLGIMSTMMNAIIDFIGVTLLFSRFGSLGDWTAYHTLLAYGLATSAFGTAEWFSRGFDVFPWYVRSGKFDRLLLRPRRTFLQVMGEKFEFPRLGRVFVGILCIVIAINKLYIYVNLINIMVVISAIAGGWFIYTGVFIVFSTASFWSIKPLQIVYTFTNHTLQLAQIPAPMLGKNILRFLTFIFPLALCYYYPAMVIIGEQGVSTWIGFMALPVGIVFFMGSLLLWKFGVNHYHSTGS